MRAENAEPQTEEFDVGCKDNKKHEQADPLLRRVFEEQNSSVKGYDLRGQVKRITDARISFFSMSLNILIL